MQSQHQPKYLSDQQLERLLAAIHSPRDIAIFRVAYHRGLRASELGLLQLDDYDQKAGRLQVHRKKKSNSGQYRLCRAERAALEAWLAIRGYEPGPLFPSRERGGISPRMLDVLMKRYGLEAGLPRHLCHMHALKHSCATHLLERGEAIEDVQDHLGHVNIQNTMIYARITNRRRDERARRLESW